MSLGDLYDPLGAHLDDPYPLYARARRVEPIFYSPVIGAWVLTKMAHARQVMRDGKTFSSANTLRPWSPFPQAVLEELAKGIPQREPFITLEGEPHRRRRAPVASFLSADRVDATEPYIAERAAELIETGLIDVIARDGHADFMAAYANVLPVDVVGRLVGFADEDLRAYGADALAGASVGMGHRWRSEEEAAECARAFVRFMDMVAGYVTQRHNAPPRDDMIGACLAAFAPDGGELTEDRRQALAGLVFGGALPGHITTSSLLGNGLLRLLEEPERWRTLCERPGLIPNAAQEIARYDTPTHIFLRVSTEDARVGDREFPAGTEFAVVLASANRDEDVFERAEEFDVTRTPKSHVVFGYGAHYCPGAALAIRQIEVSLRLLTERLPGLRLTPGQRVEYRGTLDHRGPLALHVEC